MAKQFAGDNASNSGELNKKLSINLAVNEGSKGWIINWVDVAMAGIISDCRALIIMDFSCWRAIGIIRMLVRWNKRVDGKEFNAIGNNVKEVAICFAHLCFVFNVDNPFSGV